MNVVKCRFLQSQVKDVINQLLTLYQSNLASEVGPQAVQGEDIKSNKTSLRRQDKVPNYTPLVLHLMRARHA